MKYQENQAIDLADVFRLMLRKLWLIILAALVGGAAAFAWSTSMLPLKYSSHISMYIQCYTTFNENPDLNYSNISTSKQLIKTYIEVLKDDAVMGAVGEKLTGQFEESQLRNCFAFNEYGKISPSSIRSALSISSVTDTSALSVSATTKNAEIAAAVCNSLAEVAPDYLKNAVGVGSISTIDTAKVYHNPVAPNNTKNAMLGAFAAAALVIFIIFLIYLFDTTIKDTDVLTTRYQKAIIGTVQQYGGKKNANGDDHMKLNDQNMPFSVVESYKSIRTNVSFALSPYEQKVFTVSSANPTEGKSTVSANTAIAMAQGGNKVLLIDADLRKPTQHQIFGLGNKKGLSNAIGKMNKLDECISKNVLENLDVMTAGPIPPNPSELLASENMSAILDQLKEQYALIIIDTPPINVVTDAMELAKNVSGIMLVLRYGKTSSEELDAAMKRVEFSKMDMLGFVLNGVDSKHGTYYAKGKYGDYPYGYGHKPAQTENSNDSEKASKSGEVKKKGKK